ncbi:MAG: cation:proton antiporter [Pseudomonadota bacterium]
MALPFLNAAILIAASLFLGAALSRVSARTPLPLGALLLLSGFAISEVLVAAGLDTGFRWFHFRDLVFNVLVPILIFDTAYRLDLGKLREAGWLIGFASGPILLASLAAMAVLLFIAFDHPTGFPLITALAAAALFAAVDPSETQALMVEHKASNQIGIALQGESVMSDVLAVSLFTVFVYGMQSASGYLYSGVLGFTVALLVGAALGFVFGFLGRWLVLPCKGVEARAVGALAVAFAGYLFVEYLTSGSGIVATLICARLLRPHDLEDVEACASILAAAGWSAKVILFVIAGTTITTFMFTEQWLAMLIAIAIVVMLRLVLALVSIGCANLFASDKHSWRDGFTFALGGGRGAIALALALSVPLEFEAWYTLQSMTYGVVIASLIVQPLILRVWLARLA